MVIGMENTSRTFPNRLRLFRKIAGMQQKHVAMLLGFNNPITVSTWENERKMPSGTNLMKLCILYSTHPSELYPEYYNLLKQNLTIIDE